MVQVKDLTQHTINDLWKEIKNEDDWWGDLKQEVLRVVKKLMETVMDEELIEQLLAGKNVRTKYRKGYRNGYRKRDLLTEYGLVENLRVPRDRDSIYQPQVLNRYQHRQQEVNDLVRKAFLAGVSTRRVTEVIGPLLGKSISCQTVSRITFSLNDEVRRYHQRQLSDNYLYIFLDGITLSIKQAIGAKKRLILCAYGITEHGEKELINFRQANSESEACWEAFLRDIYNRGIEGKSLKLIITDGCPGLHAALGTVYPYLSKQRCWAHKLRNVAAKLPRKYQVECIKEARKIYLAPNKREAVKTFKAWTIRWRPLAPKAVTCVENDLDELLNFLDCPESHRIKVRTTNAIERSFREVRRRTRTMSCFQNSASVDRIIFGIISHLNNSWKDKPLNEFTHFS